MMDEGDGTGPETCQASDSGYLVSMWADPQHTYIYHFISTKYPATPDTLLCAIPQNRRVTVEPPEKEL